MLSWYLVFINTFSFIIYGLDKWKAISHRWRVSENQLLTLAVLGGGIGSLLGMYFFHHKTRHPKFTIGVPLITILEACLYLFFR